MARNHFDRLSVELIEPILLELPTTESLYSLIRASPKSYQVFLASKDKILMSFMSRTIHPAAYIDALAAVQASRLKEKRPDRKEVLNFLRRYENKRHKAVEQIGGRYSLAVSLCQLYRSTQYFIKDLTSRSNFYLRRCKDNVFVQTSSLPRDGFITVRGKGPNGIWRSQGELSGYRDHRYAPLSDVEEGRLQRAFYRYELYTQIFSSDMEYMGVKLWELPSDSHFFLEKYQHWEIEELICVDDYLWSLVSNSFDRLELIFVGAKLPEPRLEDSESTSFQSWKRSVALREAKYEIHSLYRDYLSNLSLPFLHHLLRLDRVDMQREMSSHIYYDGQKRALCTGLEGYWNEMSRKDLDLIHNYSYVGSRHNRPQFKDSIGESNEGWLYVYGSTPYVSPFRIRFTIQSLGYVFWDSRRLRDSRFVGPQLGDIEERCEIKRNIVPLYTVYRPGASRSADVE